MSARRADPTKAEAQPGGEVRRLERLTVFYQALNRLTRPVAGEQRADRLIAAVIETARESLEADEALLLRLDESNGRVTTEVRCVPRGTPPDTPAEGVADGWLRLAPALRATATALISHDDRPAPALVEAGVAEALHGRPGVRSFIAAPGHPTGSGLLVLVLQATREPRHWMPEEAEFLGNLMHYLGALLQREEFQDRLRNQLQLAQGLNALLPELISAPSEPELFERLTRGLIPMLDLDRATVNGLDLRSLEPVFRHEALHEGIPAVVVGPRSFTMFTPLIKALREESPIQVSHQDAPNPHMAADGVAEGWHRATGSKTMLVVLLHENADLHITLALHSTRLRRDWAQDTVDVVNNLRLMVRLVLDRIRFDTDLKRKEGDLVEAQKIGRIGHWVADLRTNRYVGSNESLRRLGFQLDDVPEDSRFLHLIHPEDLPHVREEGRAALAGERDYSAIFRIRHADTGEWRYMHSRAVIERDPSGTPVIGRGTAQDITERHLSDMKIREQVEALRRSERDLMEAQKIGRIGHWISDLRANRYIGSNESLRRLGFRLDENPEETRILRLVHPDDLPGVEEAIRASLAGEGDYSVVFRICHADTGEWRFMHSRATVERDAAGEPLLMRGTAQDITERHLADLQIREQVGELRRLSERLLTIQEDERARIARELHDESGQLLSALKIDVDWLKEHAAAAGLRPRLAAMQRTLDQAIESSRRLVSELRPRLLDELGLHAAVAQLATDYRQRTGSACELSFDLPDSLPGPLTSHVYRIIQEALTNAIRHGGGAPAEVRAEPTEGGLLLRIRDQGSGFDSTCVAMGNGLSGIRERARLLGGHVTFRSTPGGGATIEVVIPELPVILSPHEKHRTR